MFSRIKEVVSDRRRTPSSSSNSSFTLSQPSIPSSSNHHHHQLYSDSIHPPPHHHDPTTTHLNTTTTTLNTTTTTTTNTTLNTITTLDPSSVTTTTNTTNTTNTTTSAANVDVVVDYYYDISDVIKNTELAMNESSLNHAPSSRFHIQYLKFKRKLTCMSIWSKIFLSLVIVLVTTIFIAGLTSMIFNAAVLKNSTAVYFLSAMFLFSGITLIYFACVAIFAENEYLLFAFLVQSIWGGLMAAFMVYQSVSVTIVESSSSNTNSGNSDHVTTKVVVILLIIIPSCLYYLAFLLFLMILIPVYRSFGWKIFRRVGSSPHLVRYYRFYCIYKAILQVDVGFLTALLIMAVFWLKFDWIPWSQIGLASSYLFSLICVPLTFLAIKKEWYLLQIPILLFDLVLPGYLVYKIIEAWIEKETRITKDTVLDQTAIVVIMTLISIFVLLVRFVMIAFGVICTVNFRKGLKRIFEQDFIHYKRRFYTLFGMKNRLNRLNAELQQSLIDSQKKEEEERWHHQRHRQHQQHESLNHGGGGRLLLLTDSETTSPTTTTTRDHVEKRKKKKKKKVKTTRESSGGGGGIGDSSSAYSQL
ncbi:hypothetical protein FDP41_005212 [Naegleria fowleri]|uniref:Uncharacterized protein n=1 Tax=Naegleria fowleri TaxID=5763 RepID=A0A6A5BR41_NAEFO|nr:uncharacterized protein FDP41_005212 [Naegleria fowleri]KAF0975885.1 hypothetical protein FDP41_005212 [Naegleria fowleri]